jgi:hypothetical protein
VGPPLATLPETRGAILPGIGASPDRRTTRPRLCKRLEARGPSRKAPLGPGFLEVCADR